MDRRFIVTVVCVALLLTLIVILSMLWNRRYNKKVVKYRPSKNVEGFEQVKQVQAPQGMSLRPCNIYFTKNTDLCDDTTTHWYHYTEETLQNMLGYLKNKQSSSGLTADENRKLNNINRVLADYNQLPFKEFCKLTMYGMSEATTHPYKVNIAEDAGKRGDPSHWAFCFENQSLKLQPSIKADNRFKKVFEKSGLELQFTDGARERYDVKSLANDHLLDVYCLMYTEQSIQSGTLSPLYNNRDLLEITFNDKTRKITGVKPVYYNDGGLYVSNTTRSNKVYNSLFEVIRQPTKFVIQQKQYRPIVHRMLFNLCNAKSNLPNPSATSGSDPLAHEKSVELIVDRQKYNIPDFFKLRQEDALDISSYIASYGDISDLNIAT